MTTKATLTIEEAMIVVIERCGDGKTRNNLTIQPVIRVVVHDEEGRKPRGKKGKGLILSADGGHAKILRNIADYLDQIEGDWSIFEPGSRYPPGRRGEPPIEGDA